MFQVHDGQCGLCSHFGEHHPEHQPQLVQIRTSKQASENLVEECGHPMHAQLDLLVTANSGCRGFDPARLN